MSPMDRDTRHHDQERRIKGNSLLFILLFSLLGSLLGVLPLDATGPKVTSLISLFNGIFIRKRCFQLNKNVKTI
jgi:hypothetical protein